MQRSSPSECVTSRPLSSTMCMPQTRPMTAMAVPHSASGGVQRTRPASTPGQAHRPSTSNNSAPYE